MGGVFEKFWSQHPALNYALYGYLGFASTTTNWTTVALPICLLIGSSLPRAITGIMLFLTFFTYGNVTYNLPTLPEEGIHIQGHFSTNSLSTGQTHFGQQWIYQGILNPVEGSVGKNIPTTIRLPKKTNISHPPADSAYLIEGTLLGAPNKSYTFRPDKKKAWAKVKGSFSFAEMRTKAKGKVKQYLFKRINNPRSAEFLSGIVTGDFEDRLMRSEFGKLGLQHIMAISGFHFAIVAAMLGVFFQCLVPQKYATIILILVLSSYFLFLGCSPSVMRAWIMSLVTLLGLKLGKTTEGLNALGVSIIIILLIDPMMTKTLGFQFSVITTASILLFYPIIKNLLNIYLGRKELNQVITMHIWDQHGYCFLSIFREAIALGFAVNLVALPVTLCFFQKFPLMSIVYNIFIPFLVSLSMFFVLISTIIDIILPPLGHVMHSLNSHFTAHILNYIYNLPVSMNPMIWSNMFSGIVLVLYLSVLFPCGIIAMMRMDTETKVC